MPSYFPEGWFESEHRNVGAGTIWSDWPGSGYSPGTEVVDGSVQLAEPDYTVLDNFEESTSLAYDLSSSAEQTVSLSYDWSFRGDLSFLLEHDDGYDAKDFVDFSHYDHNHTSWHTSVINVDLTDGKVVYPPQHSAYYSYDGSRYYCGYYYDEANDEIVLVQEGEGASSERVPITDADTVESILNNPTVIHAKYNDGTSNQGTMRMLPLNQASDDVYLSRTRDEYVAEWSTNTFNNSGNPKFEFGLNNAGGSGAYIDYLLEGVSP